MKQIALDIGLPRLPTLANFEPGANQAALDHLRRWSQDAGRSRVPTYVWGESGSGKTHVLQAVSRALGEQGARTGWITAADTEPAAFDEGWAAVLFDDVQAFSAVQQQAAFSWFVQAQSLRRGVLAAGTLPPAGLALREDLRTRLGWGHVFELQVLQEPERRAVLRRAADARGLILGDELANYILHRFRRDLGSLMDLLQRLDGYALRTQRPLSVPLIRAMLEDE